MALGQKEVSLKIKANTKKFQDELKKLPGVTDKEAKKMAKKFAKQFNKAEVAAGKSAKKMAASYSGSFGKMGAAAKNFKTILAAGAFASAAKGLFNLADSASRYVDKIGVMSRQTGLHNETLIAMEFASQAAGLSLDNLSAGLNTFTNKAGQAHNVGGAATRIFDRLGISVEDADGNLRDMDEVFRETVTSLSKMDTVAEQATTAIELFGARGSKIAAVFGSGTDALDVWTRKVTEAGLVMDEDAKKASADMDHAMAELKLTMRATSLEIGSNLIPSMVIIVKAMGKVIEWIAKAVIAWDNFTKAITLNIEESDEVVEDFHAMGRALNKIAKAAETAGIKINDGSGLMFDSAAMAKSLRAEMNSLSDVNQKLAKGYKLTTAESKRIWQANRRLSFAAKALGLDYAELKKNAIDVRQANLGLNESDLSDLEAELAALGKSPGLKDTGADAEKAAEALAKLNRSFELEALARVDEPLAKFEKEIDRINAALLSGLEAQLGHDAILAATDALNAARLEKEQEMQDKIAKVRDKRRERDLKAEEESAKASQAMQEEFFSGTQDLANNVFEFAKNQRGITFEEEQALAIAQAVMNTAVGVTSALKKGVAGIPAALLVGAEGALQVAAIRSQTMHAGGIVGSTPDERPANLLTGEAVITRAGVDALGGSAGVNSINSGGGAAPQVIVHQYKHRVLDVALKDQLRTDTNLNRALMGTGLLGLFAGQSRMGHR